MSKEMSVIPIGGKRPSVGTIRIGLHMHSLMNEIPCFCFSLRILNRPLRQKN